MKKLFLLLVSGFVCATSFAQENNSVLFNPISTKLEIGKAFPVSDPMWHSNVKALNKQSNERTTTVKTHNFADWFWYWEQNKIASSTQDAFAIAADSNILLTRATTPFHIWTYGLGMSFDPTDASYYGNAATTPITDAPIVDSTPYTVDSFLTIFRYSRGNFHATTPDTMIIEIAVTSAGDSGAYALRFGANASNLNITSDSTPRFATAIYTRQNSIYGVNEVWDSITAPKYRYLYPLTIADTSSDSFFKQIPLNINVPAGLKVVSFVHFKSAFTTNLATAADTNANFMDLFAGTTAAVSTAFPMQTPHSAGYHGSYQTGLVAQSQVRYEDSFHFQTHPVLIPGVAFTDPLFSVPDQAFHVKWVRNIEDAVHNVNKTISSTTAVPNPANANVAVSFNLSTPSDVTVTLINTVGQVVDRETLNNVDNGKVNFNTAALPSGIYLYTVSANGEHTTGRISVAH